ncbi:RICIN domain-containing protein [Saccharophagus degradans]|uniref:Putative retaining b-glycosidase n=1 Tax=Saccharophagus degradans (strain 2-40 / ATCC 43961 / DSM 17024) TaxID=203122 RepID=Q21GA0_SACD2|nr:RICIN domain-containing protein [Saccharophagus degradans]ABD82279.1 putative retaining b-glycosidase [Saccharophagus degradans 2-40]
MIKINSNQSFLVSMLAPVVLAFSAITYAAEPASDRIYMGAFTDRNWSESNPCGDKQTEHWEWNQNSQWFGNTNAYFGKIFPEWFLPDGAPNIYQNWKVEVERIKAQGRIPYINWEAHGQTQDGECWHGGNGQNARADRDVISEINAGQHDDLIENLAIGLREEKTKIVIDLFHEMNGAWYDWSPSCKHSAGWPAWRQAFKHVVDIFRANNAYNVEFGTSVWFGADICGNGIQDTVDNINIPGYLDWIGIDIYGDVYGNSFSNLMDPWYSALAGTGLPIVVGEMGVALSDDDEAKRTWMTEFRDSLVNQYPRVKAFNWFDIDKGWVNNEANYHIESGNAGPHFNQLMTDPRFVGSFGSVFIKNKANNKCLAIAANSNSNTANVEAADCNGAANQVFTVTDLGDFKLELRALNSDKCVDVAGAASGDGANIQQYSCNASKAQVWVMNVINWSTMEVELSAENSEKCLDLDMASSNVQQWQCYSNINQRWFLKTTPNAPVQLDPPSISGIYELKNTATNRCLDIAGGSPDTEANAQTWSCNGSSAQRFKIVDLGGYRLLLRPLSNTNVCIDVSDVSQANGANVHQWTCNGGNNQTWKVDVKNWATMEVTLSAAHSNKCLDEDQGSNNVQQWACSNANNQIWKLDVVN